MNEWHGLDWSLCHCPECQEKQKEFQQALDALPSDGEETDPFAPESEA